MHITNNLNIDGNEDDGDKWWWWWWFQGAGKGLIPHGRPLCLGASPAPPSNSSCRLAGSHDHPNHIGLAEDIVPSDTQKHK